MNKINGICLVAPNGAGKSTTYETLLEHCHQFGLNPESIKELKFAGRLKAVLSEILKIDVKLLDNQDYKKSEINLVLILEVLDYILKRFELDITTINLNQILSHEGKVMTTPREAMKYIATEFLRAIKPSIHTDILLKEYHDNSDKLIVITDCNFLNEFQVCNDLNLLSIGVFHPEICQKLADDLKAGAVHPSQEDVLKILDRCDVKILNDSTLENFKTNILMSLREVL